MNDFTTRIAADRARYREFLAAAKAGDPYAQANAEAYARRLKRMGVSASSESAPTAVAAPPSTPAPAPKPAPAPQVAVSREDAIKRIGAAHDIPQDIIAAALADRTPAADFAIAVADFVGNRRAEQAREAEIDALARQILES